MTACQTSGIKPVTQLREQKQIQHQQKLANFNQWHGAGKLLLQQEEIQYLFLFDWQRQANGNFSLRLDSQFGTGLLKVEKLASGYRVELADRAPLLTDDLNEVLQKEFGVNLPYQALEYWLKGMIYPVYSIDQVLPASLGYLDKLTQAGWQVEYQGYTEQTPLAGLVLPRKIKVTNHQQSISLFVRWL